MKDCGPATRSGGSIRTRCNGDAMTARSRRGQPCRATSPGSMSNSRTPSRGTVPIRFRRMRPSGSWRSCRRRSIRHPAGVSFRLSFRPDHCDSTYPITPRARRAVKCGRLEMRCRQGAFGGISFPEWGGCPQMCPHRSPDCNSPHRIASDIKKAETLVFIGDFGLLWTALELEMVEVGGTSNERHLS